MARASFSANPAPLAEADVIVLCLPTPLTDGAPDLTMVLTAAEDVARTLRPGVLVVLESTTYPGTTEELLRPILEGSGLVAGRDFALAYSPRAHRPRQPRAPTRHDPKVVAGLTDRCRELAVSFYSTFVHTIVTTSTPREAEMAKLIENTYRQVNIALVNELAVLANDLGVDIWESLHAAATKPFGYQPFWPGPGVGRALHRDRPHLPVVARRPAARVPRGVHRARERGQQPHARLRGARVADALNDAGKPIKGSAVLGVGVAFKPGVDDLRESPSLLVLDRLARRGRRRDRSTIRSCPECAIDGEDRAIRAAGPRHGRRAGHAWCCSTPHPSVDIHALVNSAALVFDTRGVTVGIDAPNIVRL